MTPVPEPAQPVLRPAGPGDEPFLLQLYAENRAEELANVPWSEAQRAAFLSMQYEARRRSHSALPGLEDCIVEVHGRAAGIISISRPGDQLHVVNIALRADLRNKGFGTLLLANVIAEADASGISVTLSVEKNNRAANLYSRLGFEPAADDGIYMRLVRPHRPTRTASRQGKRG